MEVQNLSRGSDTLEKLLDICGDWGDYLQQAMTDYDDDFIKHSKTGRPLGNDSFIDKAEQLLNREIEKKKPGPKR